MPDGDIVHDRLRRLYHKPYKWLCQGKATSDECARAVLGKLKKDIQNKGNLPIVLIQSIADSLIQSVSTINELGAK